MTSDSIFMITAGRSRYQNKNGETRSAFGDTDGDGYDELIVGFRGSSRHEVQVFDDVRAGMRSMVAGDGFISATDTSSTIVPTPKN